MHSRLIRVIFVLLAIAIGLASSYFLRTIDAQHAEGRAAADTLRAQAGAALATLADVRAAQASYVALGQGEEFWMGTVSKLLPILGRQIADFRAALTSPAAQTDMEPAVVAIENFHKLDARAQEYVRGGNTLLASDLIFSDGAEAMRSAAAHVQTALNTDLRLREAAAAELRENALISLAGGAGGLLLILMILGFTGASKTSTPESATADATVMGPVTFTKVIGADPGSLSMAAKVCTDMARVTETRHMPALLERTAKVLDASGLIVWVMDPTGRELRPAMTFGYADQVVARMGAIPRDASNAAAAAYREGALRTVTGDGVTSGALVAPLLTADGCIGVLSAELKGGAETDESSQALTSIFAAQLATLVSSPSSSALPRAAEA